MTECVSSKGDSRCPATDDPLCLQGEIGTPGAGILALSLLEYSPNSLYLLGLLTATSLRSHTGPHSPLPIRVPSFTILNIYPTPTTHRDVHTPRGHVEARGPGASCG